MAELKVLQADVTQPEVDAMANAANTRLQHRGGVTRAIVRATRSDRARRTGLPRRAR